MSRACLLALAAAIVPTAAVADLRAATSHDGWQLTAGAKVTAYATLDECVAAAVAVGAGTFKCKDVTTVRVEATCEGVPRPEFKLLTNAEGFTVQPGLVVELAANGVDWAPTKQEGFVKGPDWAKGVNCWVPGLVEYRGDPLAAEGPPTQEPGPMVYCVDYGSAEHPPVGKACPATAKAGCYIPPHAPDVCQAGP